MANLPYERLTADGATIPLRGTENLAVPALEARVYGNEAPNRILVDSCDSVLVGRGGAGTLKIQRVVEDGPIDSCARPRSFMRGGPGDDVLIGNKGPDVLLAGPGRDGARGQLGRDTCRAETKIRCEE